MSADVHERRALVVKLDLDAVAGLRHFGNCSRRLIVQLAAVDHRDAVGDTHFAGLIGDREPLAPLDSLADVSEADLG